MVEIIVIILLIVINAFFKIRSGTGKHYTNDDSNDEDSDDYHRMLTYKSVKDYFKKK